MPPKQVANEKGRVHQSHDTPPPAPRSVPQKEATVDMDANGTVNVSAQDRQLGEANLITTTAQKAARTTNQITIANEKKTRFKTAN